MAPARSVSAEPNLRDRTVDAVVIGASAGAIEALTEILPRLPAHTRFAVVVVVHIPPRRASLLSEIFARRCVLPVHEGRPHMRLEAGVIVFAPPDYHMLIEADRTIALSLEPPVHFSRPSIDVLFESAALAYGPALCAVVLTGASEDGVAGALAVRDAGGIVLVQDPKSAEAAMLPRTTTQRMTPDAVLTPARIGAVLHDAALGGA